MAVPVLVVVLLLASPLSASASSAGEVGEEACELCEFSCNISSDGSYRCSCPDGKELSEDGKTCVAMTELEETCAGDCEHTCKTQCNRTQEEIIDVGGLTGVLQIDLDIPDGDEAAIPCQKINPNYRGSIRVQCFKGTMMADTSQCQPVCMLGPWKPAGSCSVTCGIGRMEHRREVLQRPGRDQARCEELSKFVPCWMPSCPVDCQVTDWGDSGVCSKTCGDGIQLQTRSVLVDAKFGGTPCPQLKREVPCCEDKKCPPKEEGGCIVGPWQDAGPCNQTCGKGFKPQSRSVRSLGQMECPPSERMLPCVSECPQVHCLESEWKPVGECSATCGEGQQLEERTVLRQPANGGRLCGSLSRFVPCYMRECPVIQCSSVHANTECSGRPARGVCDLGGPCDKSHCRTMATESPGTEDIALMLRNCSRTCQESPDCEAYNWYPEERKCCFIRDVDNLLHRPGVTCYEELEPDTRAKKCKSRGGPKPSITSYRGAQQESSGSGFYSQQSQQQQQQHQYQSSWDDDRGSVGEDEDVSLVPLFIILTAMVVVVGLIICTDSKSSGMFSEDSSEDIAMAWEGASEPFNRRIGPASPDPSMREADMANTSRPYY